MGQLLFIVEDRFEIAGRPDLVLVPGIPSSAGTLPVGQPLLLKRADGSAMTSSIGGFELLHTPLPKDSVPISVYGLRKDDVPVGTEVWMADA
jgi:hypothetical protein